MTSFTKFLFSSFMVLVFASAKSASYVPKAIRENTSTFLSLDPSGRQFGPQVEFVTCESINFRPKGCPVGGAINQTFLTNQRSRADCNRGRSWFVLGNQILVTGGCRADFLVLLNSPIERQISIQCESWDFDRFLCNVDRKIITAVVSEQMSEAACIFGDSFYISGANSNSLVVNKGCRARFSLTVE